MTASSLEPPPPYQSRFRSSTKERPKNVLLFGETGAGKSAVINLLAGADVASTSPDAAACTLKSIKYNLVLPGESSDPGLCINIFDTIGLEEPDPNLPGLVSLLDAIENAHSLIMDLQAGGGIDLLLFCIRAGRITVAMQRHYRLFFQVLCRKQVPLAIVVTHLENEVVMEDWWVRNQAVLQKYGICSVAHACVTTVPVHLRAHTAKRAASRTTLLRMLRTTLQTPRQVHVQHDPWSWLKGLMEMLVDFLTGGMVPLARWALEKKLEERCAFSRKEARRLAGIILRRT